MFHNIFVCYNSSAVIFITIIYMILCYFLSCSLSLLATSVLWCFRD